jgi:hypothetical protein
MTLQMGRNKGRCGDREIGRWGDREVISLDIAYVLVYVNS